LFNTQHFFLRFYRILYINLNINNLKNKQNKKLKNNTVKIENKIPYILTKKVNTNYKLVPFNTLINDLAKNKYLPPVSKE
jgi:hypothetical protein